MFCRDRRQSPKHSLVKCWGILNMKGFTENETEITKLLIFLAAYKTRNILSELQEISFAF